MSRHVRDTKKLRADTIVWLHGWLNHERRRLRFGSPKQIMHVLERSRQGGTSDRFLYSQRKGPNSRKTDDDAEFHTKRLVLDRLKVETVHQYIDLDHRKVMRMLLSDKDRKGIDFLVSKMTGLFNIHKRTAFDNTTKIRYGNRWKECLEEWRSINRGRDIFIKGLGGFNLTTPTIQRLALEYFSPRAIAVCGHMESYEHSTQMTHLAANYEEYFVRWFHQLQELYAENTADEVLYALSAQHNAANNVLGIEGDILQVNPRRIVAAYREYVAAGHYPGIDDDNLEIVEDTHEYPVQHVPDLPIIPLNGTLRTLCPIKTYGELKEVADRLHNCAASYHSHIENKHCILVTYQVGDKPIALGEWNIKRNKWDQVVEACNKTASPAIRKLYDEYGKQLRRN